MWQSMQKGTFWSHSAPTHFWSIEQFTLENTCLLSSSPVILPSLILSKESFYRWQRAVTIVKASIIYGNGILHFNICDELSLIRKCKLYSVFSLIYRGIWILSNQHQSNMICVSKCFFHFWTITFLFDEGKIILIVYRCQSNIKAVAVSLDFH